jgi:hypothetical protein
MGWRLRGDFTTSLPAARRQGHEQLRLLPTQLPTQLLTQPCVGWWIVGDLSVNDVIAP